LFILEENSFLSKSELIEQVPHIGSLLPDELMSLKEDLQDLYNLKVDFDNYGDLQGIGKVYSPR
jgi:hypothetical protein